MFKNLTLFRILKAPTSRSQSIAKLGENEFASAGATQEKSSGWISPRGDKHGELAEVVDGQIILKLQTETKAVPADVIKRKVDEECVKREQNTGRKPGKKEKREIADEVKLSLLPMAFAKFATTLVWIDLENALVAIDSASQKQVDEVAVLLARSFDGLVMQLINTVQSPAASMSHWLVSQEPPVSFTVDRECELKATDESKSVVRYTRHALDTDEIIAHIKSGKVPTRVAMTWDDRVSFVLTESGALKKIELLDVVMDSAAGGASDGFNSDVALFTGNVTMLILDLLEALGGEIISTTGESA